MTYENISVLSKVILFVVAWFSACLLGVWFLYENVLPMFVCVVCLWAYLPYVSTYLLTGVVAILLIRLPFKRLDKK